MEWRCGRNRKAAVQGWHEYGVKVLYDGADMSKPEQIEAMMKKATISARRRRHSR